MEADLIYAWSGGIMTYLYLLESKPNFDSSRRYRRFCTDMRDNKLVWLVEPQYRHRLLDTLMTSEFRLGRDEESVALR